MSILKLWHTACDEFIDPEIDKEKLRDYYGMFLLGAAAFYNALVEAQHVNAELIEKLRVEIETASDEAMTKVKPSKYLN